MFWSRVARLLGRQPPPCEMAGQQEQMQLLTLVHVPSGKPVL